MIDAWPKVLAVTPLAFYLLWVGGHRLLGRVRVLTSAADRLQLLAAAIGLVLIGPVELFFPKTSVATFGAWVWLPLSMLLVLVATLLALGTTPRIVIYGRTLAQCWDGLRAAAAEIDPAAVATESAMQIHLPAAGLNVRLEGIEGQDVVLVLPFEAVIANPAWTRLRQGLSVQLRRDVAKQLGRGLLMTVAGGGLLIYAASLVWEDPVAVAQQASRWWFRGEV